MNATVELTITGAGGGKTAVRFSINRKGDGSGPGESITLAQRAAGECKVYSGSFEVSRSDIDDGAFTITFQAPVGARYRYRISAGDEVLAEQPDTKVTKEFDAVVGDLS